MFENIIAQDAVVQISRDIIENKFPRSVLFQGSRFSAKGTSALEIARVFSCHNAGAPWKCACPSCVRHRLLSHPDLVVIGARQFLPEIKAAKDAFIAEPESAAKMLFFRSVKKLLFRFSSIITEGDSKISKANSILETLNQDLEDWLNVGEDAPFDKTTKLCDSIIASAAKLDGEFISNTAPANHIRAGSAWLHTAPAGNKKTLIIENAENMQDAARNSLLKTLEEPPDNACIILTTSRPKMLLPTILSRLRLYNFIARPAEKEGEILRRVFRLSANEIEKLNPPLDKFFEKYVGVSADIIRGAAAFFAASTSLALFYFHDKNIEGALTALGKYTAPIAEAAGFGRPQVAIKTILETLNKNLDNFSSRETWTLFLEEILKLLGDALTEPSQGAVYLRKKFSTLVANAQSETETYNMSKPLVLENLFYKITSAV